MRVDEDYLLALVRALQESGQVWLHLNDLPEEFLLEEELTQFHLEMLADRQCLKFQGERGGESLEGAFLGFNYTWVRLTAQGQDFATALIDRYQQEAARKEVMNTRIKQPADKREREHLAYGMDDIDLIFRQS